MLPGPQRNGAMATKAENPMGRTRLMHGSFHAPHPFAHVFVSQTSNSKKK